MKVIKLTGVLTIVYASSFTPQIGAQSIADGLDIDPDLVIRADDGIDFPGCYSDLHTADRDGDGLVRRNEYLNFIQEYGKRICFKTDALTLQQEGLFNSLACLCRSQEGADPNCCLGGNARIFTAGALNPDRTPIQEDYLTSVCKLTDATIDAKCPPVIQPRGDPVPLVPLAVPTGGSDDWKWWLIALAALLFLCCFCCVFAWKRRRAKELEEEEEEVNDVVTTNKDGAGPDDLEQAMPMTERLSEEGAEGPLNTLNNVPDGTNPLAAAAAARGSARNEDSDDEEEVRKKRGGGVLPDDPDEEMLKIIGAPRLPPPEPEEQPPIKLRPIPDKENEDEEWDQPGRDIQFPTEEDEMSGQELDHYVPDGGVYMPERPVKEPLDWRLKWQREKPEDPDEHDPRKHRIQAGLGEGEVWNKLEEESVHSKQVKSGQGFDWVIQSALGALDQTGGADLDVAYEESDEFA